MKECTKEKDVNGRFEIVQKCKGVVKIYKIWININREEMFRTSFSHALGSKYAKT